MSYRVKVKLQDGSTVTVLHYRTKLGAEVAARVLVVWFRLRLRLAQAWIRFWDGGEA